MDLMKNFQCNNNQHMDMVNVKKTDTIHDYINKQELDKHGIFHKIIKQLMNKLIISQLPHPNELTLTGMVM